MSGTGNDSCVVFLPGMMGEPVYAKKLLVRLPESLPAVGFRYPGHALDCEPVALIPSLAGQFADILVADSYSAPLLFGFSFSAILAFETAIELARRGHPPARLLLVDSPLPFALRRKRLHQHVMLGLIAARQRLAGVVRSGEGPDLNELWKPDFASYHDALQPALRASYAALRAYRPRRYTGDLTVIRSTNSRRIYWGDRFQGWHQFTDGRVSEIRIRGAHHQLLDIPENQELVAHTILDLRGMTRP